MDEPADLQMAPGPPARLFTPEEASALVPTLEAILRRMDLELARQRELKELIEDQEAYWGPAVREPTNPDHGTYAQLLRELEDVRTFLERDAEEIRRLGCELKDPYLGLVDFHAWVGGDRVLLCWQRGERQVSHYHTREAGYAGRKPIPRDARAES